MKRSKTEVCNEVAGLFCQIGPEIPVLLAGSSGLRETGLSLFWRTPRVGYRNFGPEVHPDISGGPEVPAWWPEVLALEKFGQAND